MDETPSGRSEYVDLSDSTTKSGVTVPRSKDPKALSDEAAAGVEDRTPLRPHWVKVRVEIPLEFE